MKVVVEEIVTFILVYLHECNICRSLRKQCCREVFEDPEKYRPILDVVSAAAAAGFGHAPFFVRNKPWWLKKQNLWPSL